jgi:hypothetical protein
MQTCKPITLVVHGIGSVPSFKNNKMLTKGKLITDPKKQKWMDRAIRSIESQLHSLLRTTGEETSMEPQVRSLIAWSKQFDDSVQWIPSLRLEVVNCEKGKEGAEITIERIA